jgi:transcriptional regulator with XRE-family HTH domain
MPEQFERGIMSETDFSKYWWDAGTLEDSAREYVEESEESAKVYLRESWLAATMAILHRARWATNLTQAEVAERLGTTQSAIARLERADDTTFGRFWEYLYACGVVPLELETVCFEDLREYVRRQPGADRTVEPVKQWMAKSKKTVNRESTSKTPRRKQPASKDNIPAFGNEETEPYSV